MSRSLNEVCTHACTSSSSGEAVSFILPPLQWPEASQRWPRLLTNLHDQIIPNPLNPTILSPDCFTHWLMPYGIAKLDDMAHSFPVHSIVHHRLLTANFILPSTPSSYSVGLIRLTKFCDNHNVPGEEHMPTLEFILSMFITVCGASSIGNSSMKTWLEGLCLWHMINDHHGMGTAWSIAPLKYVLLLLITSFLLHINQGASKIAPQSSFQAKSDPVTIENLRPPTPSYLMNAFNITVFALVCVAFWCCCRLGELLVDSNLTQMHMWPVPPESKEEQPWIVQNMSMSSSLTQW